MTDRTANFKLPIPDADSRSWQREARELINAIDGLMRTFTLVNSYEGAWQNSTQYTVGDVVLDEDVAALYRCIVTHTSVASPSTFTSDRTTNPTYWEVYTLTVNNYRGTWAASTEYAAGDVVVSGATPTTNKFAIAVSSHTSTTDFDTDEDAGLWTVLVQGSVIASLSDGDLDGLTIDMQDKSLTRPKIIDYAIGSSSPSISGGTLTLNVVDNGNDFAVTLTENVTTLNVTGWGPSGTKSVVHLQTTQDSAGNRTFTFPAAWKVAGGVAPSVSSGANATDEFVIWTRDGGTTVFFAVVGQNFV